MEEQLKTLQLKVINAAISLCENAAYLPDGNAQIPSAIAEELGESLVELSDFEEEKYEAYFIHPQQKGLNSAQVSLQRLGMDEKQLLIERAIDAADRLYLGIFDEVVVPGYCYRILCKQEEKEIRFVSAQAIENFKVLIDG